MTTFKVQDNEDMMVILAGKNIYTTPTTTAPVAVSCDFYTAVKFYFKKNPRVGPWQSHIPSKGYKALQVPMVGRVSSSSNSSSNSGVLEGGLTVALTWISEFCSSV